MLCRRRLKDTHFRSDTNKTGAEGFLLLTQAAVLPGSDAGSDVVEPALILVIQPSDLVLRVVPDVWGTLLGCGLRFIQRRRTRNLVEQAQCLSILDLHSNHAA